MKNDPSDAHFDPPYGKILDLKGRIKANVLNYTALGVISVVFSILSILYFVNLLRWSTDPDFGWTVG